MNPEETSPVFWQTVLDTVTEGIMLVENGGGIIYLNRAMELLTGYSREELVGKTCGALDFDCCPRSTTGKRMGPCPLFRDGDLCDKRCSLKRKEGGRLTVLKNARVIRDEKGDIVCAVEAQSDLTKWERRERDMVRLRNLLKERHGFQGIIGDSEPMRRLFELIKKAASSEAPVLIYGESGTGKELAAAAIHKLGSKRSGPYIRVNCGALSESLLESELFGHTKGAFTGAVRTTVGRFEAAHNGDIFLDEVGDVPLSTQVKLLRVIQEKEFERVGDYKPIPIDVRIIAATHRNLKALMNEGLFREDLFYRLNVIPVFIPPLRERPDDIPLLIQHFISEAAGRTGKQITGVDAEAMDLLTRYSWPGNVRELINVIEYAFVVCNGDIITRSELPEMSLAPQAVNSLSCRSEKDRKVLVTDALIMAKGKRAAAARILGVSRQTLWSWIKKYGIDVEQVLSFQSHSPMSSSKPG